MKPLREEIVKILENATFDSTHITTADAILTAVLKRVPKERDINHHTSRCIVGHGCTRCFGRNEAIADMRRRLG